MAGRSTMAKNLPPTQQSSLDVARGILRRHSDWEVVKCRICGDWCVESSNSGDAHPFCTADPLHMRTPEPKKKRTRKGAPLQSESLF